MLGDCMICRVMFGNVARILEVQCVALILLVMYQERNLQIVVEKPAWKRSAVGMVLGRVQISLMHGMIADLELS